MNKRYLGFLAGCMLLLAPSAMAATGDGVQMGPALLYPLLSVTGTYDDNFRLTSENTESGWVTSIAPSLQVVLPVRRFYLTAEGGLDFLSYYDIDEDDQTDWYLGASVGADFPGGLSFKVADKQAQQFLIATQEYPNSEEYDVNNLTATVAYAIRNSLRLELSGFRMAPTYEVSTNRSRVETTVQADLYWKFRPTVSGIFEAGYTSYKYDSSTAQDGDATQVAFGLNWDVTAKSAGVIKAGYQWKHYDQQNAVTGTEDGEYFTLSGGLRHSFTPRTVLKVDLSRASHESDFEGNPYYLRTGVAASLSQRLTAKLYGRAGVRYGTDEYPNDVVYFNPITSATGLGVRTDTMIAGNLALGFDVTRWLSCELSYDYEQRDSTFINFDYDVNRVSLNAKAAF